MKRTSITRTTPIAQLPESVRVIECAVWLDVSEGAIYKMIKTGALEARQVGRLLRVPRHALARFAGVPLPATPTRAGTLDQLCDELGIVDR